MTKIELSKTGFQINNITLEFPIDITILQQALGDYRYNKKNTIILIPGTIRELSLFLKKEIKQKVLPLN